ncbi:MAG: hypothetical protein ACTHOK_16670 [Nocardioidaceae bacterium]
MTTLTITADAVAVRFTALEKVLGLVADHEVPRSAVSAVEVVPDGLHAARGLRGPGLGIPGRRKLGTWRGRGRTLVSVRRGQPAVQLTLEGQRWARWLIGADDAARLAEKLSR